MRHLITLPKLVAFLNAARSVLRQYPAVAAGVADIIVVAAARFGLHFTADEVVTAAAAATTVLTALVHMNVTPAAKPPNQGPH